MIRYAITDPGPTPSTFATRRVTLLAECERWSATAVDFVQLRERTLSASELFALCVALRARLGELHSPMRLLVNSRADVALAAGVRGVHLTGSPAELTPAQVRTLWSRNGQPEPLISKSCHTPTEAARGKESGADLILFGPVFEKVVANFAPGQVRGDLPGPPLHVLTGTGLAALAGAVAAAAPVPVLALGGVTPINTAQCMHAGAAGIAGIRLFR